MLRQGGYLMVDDLQLHAEKEMARLLSEHSGFSLALDLGKSVVFQKLTSQRFLGEWEHQPYIVRCTNEYRSFWPNPYALRDPDVVSKATYWMSRLPRKIRNRLAKLSDRPSSAPDKALSHPQDEAETRAREIH
jgi:hypothetical protein